MIDALNSYERDVMSIPAHVVVLAFRTPQRAKWFCDEVGWDWCSSRVVYPVHVDDLDHLDLDCTAIVAQDQRVGRWSGMTDAVEKRLDDLVGHMDVLLIHEDEFEQEEES